MRDGRYRGSKRGFQNGSRDLSDGISRRSTSRDSYANEQIWSGRAAEAALKSAPLFRRCLYTYFASADHVTFFPYHAVFRTNKRLSRRSIGIRHQSKEEGSNGVGMSRRASVPKAKGEPAELRSIPGVIEGDPSFPGNCRCHVAPVSSDMLNSPLISHIRNIGFLKKIGLLAGLGFVLITLTRWLMRE